MYSKMHSSDEIIFRYFVTIFYVYYLSWFKNRFKSKEIRSRFVALCNKLQDVCPVQSDRITSIEKQAIMDAKVYRKSINIILVDFKTNTDNIPIRLNIDSPSHQIPTLQIESDNRQTFLLPISEKFEDKSPEFYLVITIDNCSKKYRIYESEISGYSGYSQWTQFDLDEGPVQIQLSLDWSIDRDSCAHNLVEPQLIAQKFSTVLLVLGFEYWKLFRVIYETLAFHQDIEVRKIAMMSLHEIAFIVSHSNRVKHLLPIFTDSLNRSDSVCSVNLMQNSIIFFTHLDRTQQIVIITEISKLLRDNKPIDRRTKNLFVKKLLAKINDYSVSEINEFAIPLIFEFLPTSDEYLFDLIRKLFSLSIQKLFPKRLKPKEDYKKLIQNQYTILNSFIKRFTRSESVKDRKTFVSLCHQLLDDKVLPDNVYDNVLKPYVSQICAQLESISYSN